MGFGESLYEVVGKLLDAREKRALGPPVVVLRPRPGRNVLATESALLETLEAVHIGPHAVAIADPYRRGLTVRWSRRSVRHCPSGPRTRFARVSVSVY